MVHEHGGVRNSDVLRMAFDLVTSYAAPICVALFLIFPNNFVSEVLASLRDNYSSGIPPVLLSPIFESTVVLLLGIPSLLGSIWLCRWIVGRTQGEEGREYFEEGMTFADIGRMLGFIGIGVLLGLAVVLPFVLLGMLVEPTVWFVAGGICFLATAGVMMYFWMYAFPAIIVHRRGVIEGIRDSIEIVRVHRGETFALLVVFLLPASGCTMLAAGLDPGDQLAARLVLRLLGSVCSCFLFVFLTLKYLALRPLLPAAGERSVA